MDGDLNGRLEFESHEMVRTSPLLPIFSLSEYIKRFIRQAVRELG